MKNFPTKLIETVLPYNFGSSKHISVITFCRIEVKERSFKKLKNLFLKSTYFITVCRFSRRASVFPYHLIELIITSKIMLLVIQCVCQKEFKSYKIYGVLLRNFNARKLCSVISDILEGSTPKLGYGVTLYIHHPFVNTTLGGTPFTTRSSLHHAFSIKTHRHCSSL